MLISCAFLLIPSSVLQQTGISNALKTLAEKHRHCPECSLDFNSQLFASKVIDEDYVAAIVSYFEQLVMS